MIEGRRMGAVLYTVILLEDFPRHREATRRDIRHRDPSAKVVPARTVQEAKDKVSKDRKIAYAVVDLWMIPNKAAPNKAAQGKDFITWLLDEEETARLPIFAMSVVPEMIDELKAILRNYPHHQVTIVQRTWDFDKLGAELSKFISHLNRDL